MRHSTKALAIAGLALATAACGGGNKAATNNSAGTLAPINTMMPGNDASAMESMGAPGANTMTPLPPVPSSRNTVAPAGNSAHSEPSPSSGPTRVESNVSGM